MSQRLEPLAAPRPPRWQESFKVEPAPGESGHGKRSDRGHRSRDRRDRNARTMGRLDEPLAWITHEGCTGIRDECQVFTLEQAIDQKRDLPGLVMGVTGDERDMDLEVGEELARVARVLGHDPVGERERRLCTRTQVPKIADRGGHHIETARGGPRPGQRHRKLRQ